jgi:hypothetical protein
MKNRIPAGIIVLALAGLSGLLGSCTSLSFTRLSDPACFKNADLVGMVYQGGNRPCPGVSVELLEGGTEDPLFRGFTDLNGRFIVPRLVRGEHRLRFTRRGYQELTVAIRFSDPTHIFYTRMVSIEELLLHAEEALDDNRWNQVNDLLDEAARIDPLRGELVFLRAVAAVRQGLDQEAKRWLAEMENHGFPLPSRDGREGGL